MTETQRLSAQIRLLAATASKWENPHDLHRLAYYDRLRRQGVQWVRAAQAALEGWHP